MRFSCSLHCTLGGLLTDWLTGWNLQDIGQQEVAPTPAKASLQDAADAQPDSSSGPQSAAPVPMPRSIAREAHDKANSNLGSGIPSAASTLSAAAAGLRDPETVPLEQGKAGHEPQAASMGMISGNAASSRQPDSQTGDWTSGALLHAMLRGDVKF